MFNLDLFNELTTWKKGYALGADIGASGIRIQLVNLENTNDLIELPHAKASSAKNIKDIIQNIKECIKAKNPNLKCCGSAFAMAGLRRGNTVWVQNWTGPEEETTIDFDKLDPDMFPPNHSDLLNDLEAGAYGLISMSEKGNVDEYFEKLWGPSDSMVINNSNNSVIFAIGSGLGGSIITKPPNPTVIPMEPGFILTSQYLEGSEDDVFCEVFDKVSEYYYKNDKIPVYEDFSSGRGISLIYKILTKSDEMLDAGKIVAQAKEGDEISFKAMEISYIYFARLIKQIITTFDCKSSIMALSNQAANYWFVNSIKSKLQKEILSSADKETVMQCGVYTQIKDYNFNLLGASYMAVRCSQNK